MIITILFGSLAIMGALFTGGYMLGKNSGYSEGSIDGWNDCMDEYEKKVLENTDEELLDGIENEWSKMSENR